MTTGSQAGTDGTALAKPPASSQSARTASLDTALWRATLNPTRRRQEAIKRLLDLLGAGLALLVTLPLIALLALLIRIGSPGPALFKQQRLGRWGRSFAIYKLRTMVKDAPMVVHVDGSTCVVDGDARVTRLGSALRAHGLDELSQLFNVLKGDMSLIGPRPDLVHQLEFYTEKDRRRLAMRPGITSMAQVSGRNTLSWRQRQKLEIEYVERFSLRLDAQIAWRTVGVMLSGEGANNPTLDTSPHVLTMPVAPRREEPQEPDGGTSP